MRRRELNKIKLNKINGIYSDFELQELAEEIVEYNNILRGIGFKVKKIKKKVNSHPDLIEIKDEEKIKFE